MDDGLTLHQRHLMSEMGLIRCRNANAVSALCPVTG